MKKFYPIIILFLVVALLINTSTNFLLHYNINNQVLNAANLFLLSISIFSMTLQLKAMGNKNPNVFIRSVMSSMLLKMFCSMIAIGLYVYTSGNDFNKKGVFISLFLYLIYLSVEVFTLIKLNNKKNA